MNVIWDQPQTIVSGNKPAHIVEPFEDWEQATRKSKFAEVVQIWKPVFVELSRGAQGDYSSSIKALAKFMLKTDKGRTLRFDPDFLPVVVNIIVGELTGKNVERFARFFLYRSEAEAYCDIPGCETLHVGVGFPIGKSAALVTMDALDSVLRGAKRYARNATSGDMPAEVQHHYVLDRTLHDKIATGIIDEVQVVSNERFRNEINYRATSGEARHEYFWQQTWQAVRGGDGVAFGRSLNGSDSSADLNDVVYDGAVDEFELYRQLKSNNAKRPMAVGSRIAPNAFDIDFFSSPQSSGLPTSGSEANGNDVRPVMFVQLPSLSNAPSKTGRLEFFILAGVIRMLRWADNWTDNNGAKCRVAATIKLSQNVSAIANQGAGFLEREIARLARQRTAEGVATAVVLSQDTEDQERSLTELKLPRGETGHFTCDIQSEDQSLSFMEIWLDQLNKASLKVTGPIGDPIDLNLTRGRYTTDDGSVVLTDYTLDKKRSVIGRGDYVIARAYVRRFQDTSKTRIVLAFAPSLNQENRGQVAPAGAYKLELTNQTGAPLHASITVHRENAQNADTHLASNSDPNQHGAEELDPEARLHGMSLWTVGPVSRLGSLASYAGQNVSDVYVVAGAPNRGNSAPKSEVNPSQVCDGQDFSAEADDGCVSNGILTAGT